MIYLDNAATTYPKPKSVYYAVQNSLKEYYANPGRAGYNTSLKTSEIIFSTREKLADFFNAPSAECVAFTGNCTLAVNIVIKGLLEKGDHVLCSDLEHNCVLRPLEKLKCEGLISYETFNTDLYDKTNTLLDIKSKLRANTKLIICTHSSNVFSVLNPISEIGELCKQRDIYFAVDAAQSAGVIAADMQKMNINFLCLPSHKSLFGIMGAGALITDSSVLPNTLIEGGTGSASLNLLQPDFMPDRLESGTLAVPAIISMGAGIDFINRVGMKNIYSHEKDLILELYNNLKEISNIQMYVDYNRLNLFSPILSFNIKDSDSEKTARLLAEKGLEVRAGIHCAPLAHKKMGTHNCGTVRISPSFFTTKNDINYTISTIKKLA